MKTQAPGFGMAVGAVLSVAVVLSIMMSTATPAMAAAVSTSLSSHGVDSVTTPFHSPQPDPTCATGVAGPGGACCLKSCGSCGGAGCGARPGGDGCCGGAFKNRSCASFPPPCTMAPPPPPATECGDYPLPLSSTLKNVMLVGDSISMPLGVSPGGYGNNVKDILTAHGGINVWHNGGWGKGGQASNTVKGLLCTNTSTNGYWLNFTGTVDVLHFNFGLHDLVARGPGEGQEHVDIPQYGLNLAEIYKRFASRATKVIWTTTTPCPNVTTSMGRTNANVIKYNAEAMQVLQEVAGSALIVDDLYSAIVGYCGENYKSCDLQLPANVHFTPKGCEFMGEHVSKTILAALGE